MWIKIIIWCFHPLGEKVDFISNRHCLLLIKCFKLVLYQQKLWYLPISSSKCLKDIVYIIIFIKIWWYIYCYFSGPVGYYIKYIIILILEHATIIKYVYKETRESISVAGNFVKIPNIEVNILYYLLFSLIHSILLHPMWILRSLIPTCLMIYITLSNLCSFILKNMFFKSIGSRYFFYQYFPTFNWSAKIVF